MVFSFAASSLATLMTVPLALVALEIEQPPVSRKFQMLVPFSVTEEDPGPAAPEPRASGRIEWIGPNAFRYEVKAPALCGEIARPRSGVSVHLSIGPRGGITGYGRRVLTNFRPCGTRITVEATIRVRADMPIGVVRPSICWHRPARPDRPSCSPAPVPVRNPYSTEDP